MYKSDYTYTIENNLLRIVDLNLGNMSVTNNAEEVLTEILKVEGKQIKNLSVIYRDSEYNWDTLIPIWEDNKCVSVEFKFGI